MRVAVFLISQKVQVHCVSFINQISLNWMSTFEILIVIKRISINLWSFAKATRVINESNIKILHNYALPLTIAEMQRLGIPISPKHVK